MESTSLKELFGRRNIRFVIPAYQRAYAWEKRQYVQYIEDLKECDKSKYYLGHFCSNKIKLQKPIAIIKAERLQTVLRKPDGIVMVRGNNHERGPPYESAYYKE